MRLVYRFMAVIVVSALGAMGVEGSEPPLTVSPGSDRGSVIGDPCPTFSWGDVGGSRLYELVVYRLDQEAGDAEEVLRQRIPGSATSWTPALDHCLEPGVNYAWSIRASGEREVSDWSAPALFELTAPTAEELEDALAVVRSYLTDLEGEASETSGETRPGAEPEPDAAPRASAAGTTAGSASLVVDGGVEAASFTGDGASLENLDASKLGSGTVPSGRLSGAYAVDITGNAATAGSLLSTVPVAGGGTGATTAVGARTNLGAAESSHQHVESDITDLAHTPAPVLSATMYYPFDSVATNSPLNRVILNAAQPITITDVFVHPTGGLTADDSNYATLKLHRRDADLSNTDTVASTTTQPSGTGDWTPFIEVSAGALSNTSVAAGQFLVWSVSKTGGGVAEPPYTLVIEYQVD